MLRRAVIQHLKGAAPSLGGRVYQAFLAPANTPRPYATVKLMDGGASTRISFAGDHLVEVRLYEATSGSFLTLDTLARSVIAALHGKTVKDLETGEEYDLYWVPGINDFVEEDRQLIGRLVRFRATALFERG